MSKPNMRDVARHAGVSVATVSHVINGTRYVREETRNKVLHSIKALNYSIDPMARALKTGKRNLLAFIVPDIANPFFAYLIQEVENTLAKRGYHLIILNTKETEKLEIESIKSLAGGTVDGFIVASTLVDYKEIETILSETTPFVFVDRSLKNCPYDSIVTNNYSIMREGMEHLLKLGHKKIGYITGLPRLSTSQERLSGYLDAMSEANLSTKNLIRYGNSMKHCVRTLLPSLLEEGCTALVVSNNVMSEEALYLLLQAGIKPGKDIEVLAYKDHDMDQVGFDQMNLIIQPTAEMGHIAGEQILRRLETPNAPPMHKTLQSYLKIRKGT